MSNRSESIVPKTTAEVLFSLENRGKTEREEKRNCWQRLRSAFSRCFGNLTDCLNFWFCKNECCNFCCSCDDYYDDDDENERSNTMRVVPRSSHNWEAWTVAQTNGIANEAVGTENEEFSSIEIHQGVGDFEGCNNSEDLVENHSGDEQFSQVQYKDNEVCVIEDNGDTKKQSEGPKDSHSGSQQSSGVQHEDNEVCVIEGYGDTEKQTEGQKDSHSGDLQSSGVQHKDNEVCVIEGYGNTEKQSDGHKESHSGNQQSSGDQHNNQGLCVIGHLLEKQSVGHKETDSGNQQPVREFSGGSDAMNNSGGHNTSVGYHSNHGTSYSGNDSGGHHTSGGDHTNHGESYSGYNSAGHHTSGDDYGVTSDFGGSGDLCGWSGGVDN